MGEPFQSRQPLTPSDCDLRDFPFMPLDCARFFDSTFASIEDPEAFRAGVLAWVKSWHQVPAASLPDDDRQLCSLLGYGRDLDLWKRTRAAGALRGFELCADGRLYHAVVAEKARYAWDRKQRLRENGRKGNAKRWNKAPSRAEPAIADASPGDEVAVAARSPGDREAIARRSPNDRKGEREGEGEKRESLVSDSFADLGGAKSAAAKGAKGPGEPRSKQVADWRADADFLDFRGRYPKTDKAPAQTHKAWLKAVKKSPAAAIIAAVGGHPFAVDEKYRPDPATWLNGECWHVTGHLSPAPLPGMVNGVRSAPGVTRTASGQAVTLEIAAELGL